MAEGNRNTAARREQNAQAQSMVMDDISRNPLIADNPAATIVNVVNVLAFLQWIETSKPACDLGDEEICGRMLIVKSISSAVNSLTPHLKTSAEVAHG